MKRTLVEHHGAQGRPSYQFVEQVDDDGFRRLLVVVSASGEVDHTYEIDQSLLETEESK